MKEQYETQEQKIAALQYLPVLAVAWRDREVSEDEQVMMATFALDVLKIPSLMSGLSDQYRALQKYDFAKDEELKYEGKNQGVDIWLPVEKEEERILDKNVLTREYAQFLRFVDAVYESKSGKKPEFADRNTREYVATANPLIDEFGIFFYLNKNSNSKNLSLLGQMIKDHVDPYSLAHVILPSKGEEFERLESAVINMFNEGKIKSDSEVVKYFFKNRFGKTYSASEFEESKLEIRLSGLEMRNILFKALRGEPDIFKDDVSLNARCVPLLSNFSKDVEKSTNSELSDKMRYLHKRCAEANFAGAYDVADLFKESRREKKFRQVQFEDLKNLIGLLQVAMDDGVITSDERALYKTMSRMVGLPSALTDFILNEQVTGKVLAHPEFK